MLLSNYLLLVVIQSLIRYSFGEVPKANCIKTSKIDKLDTEQITGHWYVQRTTSEVEAKLNCLKYTVAIIKNGIGNVSLTRNWRVSNEYLSVTLILFNNDISSGFNLKWLPHKMTSSLVLGTDYTSYILTYVCIPGYKHDGLFFISTRERNPNSITIQHGFDDLASLGIKIDTSEFKMINHTDCNN